MKTIYLHFFIHLFVNRTACVFVLLSETIFSYIYSFNPQGNIITTQGTLPMRLELYFKQYHHFGIIHSLKIKPAYG